MGVEHQRPSYRVLSNRVIALAALVLVILGMGVATLLLLAYGSGSDVDRNRLEAIKTAGTIVVGTGGAAALWLSARRQRTTEIALRQKDLEQAHQERVAEANEADARERRVTELYTKAAEQLGSDKAPVRLAGMYALRRLAQSTPDQRQTIVDVLCAYLRMPYTPPASLSPSGAEVHPGTADNDKSGSAPPGGAPDSALVTTQREDNERREQERQVRLTAQRILTTHLHPDRDPGHPAETFWPKIDLDLTGATLIDFDLINCHLHTAQFRGAQFTGLAVFDGAQFAGNAGFRGAQFIGLAGFGGAQFSGAVQFNEALFTRDAGVRGARVRLDVPDDVRRTWPAGYAVATPATPEDAQLPGIEGTWGYVVRTDDYDQGAPAHTPERFDRAGHGD